MKIKCFVAIAFRADIEYFYDNGISIALNECNVIPRRVDKINHNDRIDQKIREEIKKADFAIGDLTFARPSVYWESGFAEKSIPVIYTCRSDHFDKKNEYGIHFDLANANIIKWDRDKLDSFIIELINRIELITKPIYKKESYRSEIRRSRKLFSRSSPSEKQKLINNEISASLLKSGCKECVYFPLYPKHVGLEICNFIINNKQLIIFLPLFRYFTQSIDEIIDNEKRNNPIKNSGDFSFFENSINLPFISGSKKELLYRFRIKENETFHSATEFSDDIVTSIDSIRKVMIISLKNSFNKSDFERQFPTWKQGIIDIHYFDPNITTFYMPTGVEPYISNEILLFSGVKSIFEFKTNFKYVLRKIIKTNKTIDKSSYGF